MVGPLFLVFFKRVHGHRMWFITPWHNADMLKLAFLEGATLGRIIITTGIILMFYPLLRSLRVCDPLFLCRGVTLVHQFVTRLQVEGVKMLDICAPAKAHVCLELPVLTVIQQYRSQAAFLYQLIDLS